MTVTITPTDYRTDPAKRDLADRVMAAGGLDRNEVFEIIDLGDRYRCGLYVRDADGKIILIGVGDDREPDRRWVEVSLP
jgi:hypothetical protein